MGPWEKAKKRKRWEGDAGVNVEDQEDSVLSSKKEKKNPEMIDDRIEAIFLFTSISDVF